MLGESDWGIAAASPAELETDGLGPVLGGVSPVLTGSEGTPS